MRIESGPTTERKVRTLLMIGLCAGMGAWFAYDGYIGYPAKNFEEQLEQLDADVRAKAKNAKIYDGVTIESLADARKAVKKLVLSSQREAFVALYGGPPSYEGDGAWYYFGPDFLVKAVIKDGRIRRAVGQKMKKTLQDMQLQKVLAYGLGAVSLIFFVHLVRILRVRVLIDDAGLSLHRRPSIAWNQMKALDAGHFDRKGWVDLIYDDDGGERRVRLDEYHFDKFKEVLDQICFRKGFENPIILEKAGDRPTD